MVVGLGWLLDDGVMYGRVSVEVEVAIAYSTANLIDVGSAGEGVVGCFEVHDGVGVGLLAGLDARMGYDGADSLEFV